MATLYDLTGEYLTLLDMAQDPEIEEQMLLDTMEAITGELSVKAGGYVAVMNNLQSRADMYKQEAKRLSSAATVMEDNIKRMKDRIKYVMEQMQIDKLESDYNVIKIVKNGGVKPLTITGEVPDNYKKIIYEDDKSKIRKDLEAGIELEFAHLEERGTHLKIS